MSELYFEELDKECKELFNLKSFTTIQDFMGDFKIEQIYFNGGAILNQDKLKKEFEIDDWDIHLIQEEKDTETIYRNVKDSFNEVLERGSTASTYKSLIFNYSDKKFDFQVKKAKYRPENHCTFDIDSLCTLMHKDNPNFLVQNPKSLISLRKQKVKLQAKQSDIYRILRRLVILVAKYDIKKFKIDKDTTIIMEENNIENIKKLNEQKIRDEIKILEKSDKTKASIITKFLCMCYRVKDPFEYVSKINKSSIFDYIFPNFSNAIKDEKFLSSLKTETSLPEEERNIKSTNDFVVLLMQFNKDNTELASELLILKQDVFNEVNMNTIELISKKSRDVKISMYDL